MDSQQVLEFQGPNNLYYICDGCRKQFFEGDVRYHCTVCPDFDLCERCRTTIPLGSSHQQTHKLVAYRVHLPPSVPQSTSLPSTGRIVLFDFGGYHSQLLSVHSGETVQVIPSQGRHYGYCMCRNASGREGLVPQKFLSPETPPQPFPHRPPFSVSSLPTETSSALELHADAVNGFAVRLLEGQKETAMQKDVIVSALSLHQGLVMAANGAEDRAANPALLRPAIHSFTELTQYLGFPGLTSHEQVCVTLLLLHFYFLCSSDYVHFTFFLF